jgi:hypothetical protein
VLLVNDVQAVALWAFLSYISIQLTMISWKLTKLRESAQRDRQEPPKTTGQGHAVFPFSGGSS